MTDEQKDELREKQWELAMNGDVECLFGWVSNI